MIKGNFYHGRAFRCDRLVVRTLRCGRNNPGSNPGHGINCFHIIFCYELIIFMNGTIDHRSVFRCDRLVVRTLRCGRNNPGSNPGRCMIRFNIHLLYFVMNLIIFIKGNIFHR